MYDIKCDTHTHTFYSRHAYSTIQENVRAAADAGMELLASTDHFSAMLWTEPENLKNYQYLNVAPSTWPKEWMGVTLLCGCEADIVTLDGDLFGYDIKVSENIVGDPFSREFTLYNYVTRNMDYVIASVHGKAFTDGATRNQMTDMYIKALEHEKVFILGHVGRSGLDVDFKAIAQAAKDMHKLLEVNEHSFGFNGAQDDVTYDRCRDILLACAEVGCKISLATDAHMATIIGKFEKSKSLLEEIHFPEELIAGLNRDTFLLALKEAGIKDLTKNNIS